MPRRRPAPKDPLQAILDRWDRDDDGDAPAPRRRGGGSGLRFLFSASNAGGRVAHSYVSDTFELPEKATLGNCNTCSPRARKTRPNRDPSIP